MKKNFGMLLSGLKLNPGASRNKITSIEMEFQITFPEDYKEFILLSNGASGFVEKSYLLIWPLETLEEVNRFARANEYAVGLFPFGSDGGGQYYAFDIRQKEMPIVEFPSIGMQYQDLKFCGYTFHQFLNYIAIKNYSEGTSNPSN